VNTYVNEITGSILSGKVMPFERKKEGRRGERKGGSSPCGFVREYTSVLGHDACATMRDK
jgi:hypothetical protein